MPQELAEQVGEMLSLDERTVLALQRQPVRTGLGDLADDPTIYRFSRRSPSTVRRSRN